MVYDLCTYVYVAAPPWLMDSVGALILQQVCVE